MKYEMVPRPLFYFIYTAMIVLAIYAGVVTLHILGFPLIGVIS